MNKYKSERPCKRGHYERYKSNGDCAECTRLANRARIAANPDGNRSAVKRWAANNPLRVMLRKAKWRAKRAGVPFTISTGDVVVPDVCPVLGVRLVRGSGDCAPTLDRRIPELGYVPGNVAVISNKANRIKNDATLADLEAVIAWLRLDSGVAQRQDRAMRDDNEGF